MSGAGLREQWERVYKGPAPIISPDLLRLGIAFALQERSAGKLSRRAEEVLRAAAVGKQAPPSIMPGTRLIRDWNGRTICVVAAEEGFVFEDRHYRSLSAIAREVTGTSRSGPHFFGLHGAKANGEA